MRYHRKLWSVDMPDGWTYDEAGASVAFFNPNGAGAFNVSAHLKRRPVTDSDLREFAEGAQLGAVVTPHASGFVSKEIQGDKSWMKWWLRSANVMVLVTYICDIEDYGTEQPEIDHLLSSLEVT